MKQRLLIPVAVIVAGLGIYFLVFLIMPDHVVPEEFSRARIQGAELAQRIVGLSSESLASLEKIAEYDKEGNKPQALILISQEVIKNRENYEAAIKLSSQLERMARSLADIKPTAARVLATEAVSAEVALVSRLLSYNDSLLQLFETLRAKFQGQLVNADGKVQAFVDKINEEARAINDFDRRFNSSLAEFDKLF